MWMISSWNSKKARYHEKGSCREAGRWTRLTSYSGTWIKWFSLFIGVVLSDLICKKKKSILTFYRQVLLPVIICLVPFPSLEWEEKRQYEGHHDADDELQGEAYLDVVHEGVLACLHNQRIGRRGEWGGEAHAGSQRNGEEEGVRTYA